jgi:hypothetical protein
VIYDWAEMIRARNEANERTAVERILDAAADGPRKAERAIGSVLGLAVVLVMAGYVLGRR